MSFFDYSDGRGSDQYTAELLQLLQSGRQEATPPAQMQVNVRPAPQMPSGGAPGMTEEQAEDAEKAQIISAIGGALSGGIGAYGQANQTGAYAQGAPLGGGSPMGGATAGGAVVPSVAGQQQLAQSGIVPRGPTTTAYDPSVQRTVQVPPTYGSGGAQVDSALAARGFQQSSPPPMTSPSPLTSPSSPTGASTIKHPGLDALSAQNEALERARRRFSLQLAGQQDPYAGAFGGY